jgi:hypothetical protein
LMLHPGQRYGMITFLGIWYDNLYFMLFVLGWYPST